MMGLLQPLLSLIHRDRDLIAEIRADRLDVYCKGNRLIGVEPKGPDSYSFRSNSKFMPEKIIEVKHRSEVEKFCRDKVPAIKREDRGAFEPRYGD